MHEDAGADAGADAMAPPRRNSVSAQMRIDQESGAVAIDRGSVTIDRGSGAVTIYRDSSAVTNHRGSEYRQSSYLFSSQRGSNALKSQSGARAHRSPDNGNDSTDESEISAMFEEPRATMKLYSVAPETDLPEHATRYKGRLRRWPGATLILVFVLAVVAACIAAGLHYSKKSDTRVNEFIKKEQRRRAIQDGLIPYDDLVDADGEVNNPVSYVSISSKCQLPDYQSKNGQIIAISPNGTEVPIAVKGTNWFGMETGEAIPFGLWQNDQNGTTVYELVSFLARNKFNSIRFPLNVKHILKNTVPSRELININANRAVNIKNYMTMIQSVAQAMAYRGISILISMHWLDVTGAGLKWYGLGVTKEDFLNAIDILTKNLCTNEYWNIIGIDLKNEPVECEWGGGECNWVKGAKIIADRMHEGCPNWLGFVEGPKGGPKTTPDGLDYYDWWGGALQKAETNSIQFKLKNKLVWSPHYYTPAVAPQPSLYENVVIGPGGVYTQYTELDDATLKKRIQSTINHMFGHLTKKKEYAVLPGEFGGLYAKDGHPKKTTQRSVDFTIDEFITEGYAGGYQWSLNPESGYDYVSVGDKKWTTEGLLQDDWLTPNKKWMEAMAKFDTMKNLQKFPCFTDTKA